MFATGPTRHWVSVLVRVCPEFRGGTSCVLSGEDAHCWFIRISAVGSHLLYLIISAISVYGLSFMCVDR